MAILPIVTYPADILEKECELVKRFDRQLIKLLNDMYDTMVEADGVGLAAPQVGIAKQIAVVDVGDEHGRIELINPVILEARGEQTGPEGCLSFPGLFGEVKRADYVKVRAQDRRGRPFTLEATGFLARALQHEIDHLHGILFTSKVIRYYDPEELEG
ncbi:peptide deformylase [Parageobacillus sp. VR-IP]|uniref:peptide deformylase n=1 Tax=Anoxybacillaceae TaxID=3120669 RepID=UPI000779E491|nr:MULTISPECIES: peptide deformylase [Parageobacillus]NUK29065.1 peptide deformylase [Parageobacillus sp. VR-IP]QXJ37439.1 Peptide deformylase 1 [Parageobacillus caldoxylosilyticus]BDG35091.1 peptide deformylase [Parageobacillus caldoxylosilyticus]BDG38866.1 peptide deformylase [Parageobacillus caldoxylosilyticus]BDG42666.1 peptide deformylase [Parageobacillus caldoxylosilyticus]